MSQWPAGRALWRLTSSHSASSCLLVWFICFWHYVLHTMQTQQCAVYVIWAIGKYLVHQKVPDVFIKPPSTRWYKSQWHAVCSRYRVNFKKYPYQKLWRCLAEKFLRQLPIFGNYAIGFMEYCSCAKLDWYCVLGVPRIRPRNRSSRSIEDRLSRSSDSWVELR